MSVNDPLRTLAARVANGRIAMPHVSTGRRHGLPVSNVLNALSVIHEGNSSMTDAVDCHTIGLVSLNGWITQRIETVQLFADVDWHPNSLTLNIATSVEQPDKARCIIELDAPDAVSPVLQAN